MNGPVNLTRLFSITGQDSYPQLQYLPFTPAAAEAAAEQPRTCFSVIGKQDVLLLHPFESFTPVVDLLRQAAKDPHVLAIKQTLYRTGANSEIVDALVDAARAGKEVTAVVELRARFDEESNLHTGHRACKQAGAMVIYGVVGIKTHAKLMLIQRREGGELVRYAHLGTGNYHTGNARLYTDYSLLTSDEALCEDVQQAVQPAHRHGQDAAHEEAAACAVHAEEGHARPDRPRDRTFAARRQAGADHRQVQLADRAEDHPRAVQGQQSPACRST